ASSVSNSRLALDRGNRILMLFCDGTFCAATPVLGGYVRTRPTSLRERRSVAILA
ncbi:hypothetical protein BaRGS_00017673, partial [Batillaria attramentaria]